MSSAVRLPFYFLWIVPHAVQVIIIIALLRRSLYRQIPFFTAYTGFTVCRSVALFLISRSPSFAIHYFDWFSFGLAVSAALRFGIIFELFAHVFRSRSALRHLEKPLVRGTTVLLLIIAFSLAIYTHRNSVDPTWFVVHVLERSASLIQSGLILCLFIFAAAMHISWQRSVFGIALGLGILSSVEFALAAVRSQIGRSAHVALDLLTMGTYLSCVLIWLFCLLVPEKIPECGIETLPENDLEIWNQELQHLLHQQ